METSMRFNSTQRRHVHLLWRALVALKDTASDTHTTRRLKLHVKERFNYGDGTSMTLLGDLDTTTGALALTGVARKSVYMKDSLLTRVDLDTTITSDGRVTYGVAGHSAVDLTSDGLLALEARLGCTLPSNAFASAWGRRHGSGVYATVSGARAAKRAGRAGGGSGGDGGSLDFGGVAKALGNALVPEGIVAVSQVFLNFNGKQDVKLTAGYDIATRQPFLAVKENAWAVRAELSGKWEVSYML